MNRSATTLLFVLSIVGGSSGRAQDNERGGVEPIVSSIDPASLTYDYLVDGSLAQDDPAAKKFRTLPAAYAAAPAGTPEKPTVIGLRPNVYLLPGRAPRGPSLSIQKDYLTLLGLTNDRRTVVLADNRGMMQGADDDGYILDVNATGFTAKNLTIINYCNADYEYPGDPTKNLSKRSEVITQGVALQAAGDKHVYENVALLGRLDTMFLRTTRSYFKNVYIEGTDDWMGGGQISVWEDCTLVYPTGHGVMSASGIVFFRCRFEADRGMQFYKAEFRSAERPNALIDCILPVNSARSEVSWVRGVAPPRPSQLSLTYRNRDAHGAPAVIRDCTVGAPAYTYSRELSARERTAFNSWNLLRAAPNASADDWDPTGTKSAEEAAGEGNLAYRIALTGGSPSIRTGGPGATIGAAVTPLRARGGAIAWSTDSALVSLSGPTGPAISVTGRNATDRAEWVSVRATAPDGFYVTSYVYVEPRYLDPPAMTAGPTLVAPADGKARVDYTLDLGGKEDESLVSWFVCDDAAGSSPRKIAVSRGDWPLREIPLTPGDVGKYLKVVIQPKHRISDPGPGIAAIAPNPVAPGDVRSSTVSPHFRNFVPEPNADYVSGRWTVLGTWTVVSGDNLVAGYGIRPSTPGALLYQQGRGLRSDAG